MDAAKEVPVVDKTDGLLQIGEVAERVGLSLRSVRFYEESGLLTPQARSAGASGCTPKSRSSACS